MFNCFHTQYPFNCDKKFKITYAIQVNCLYLSFNDEKQFVLRIKDQLQAWRVKYFPAFFFYFRIKMMVFIFYFRMEFKYNLP